MNPRPESDTLKKELLLTGSWSHGVIGWFQGSEGDILAINRSVYKYSLTIKKFKCEHM